MRAPLATGSLATIVASCAWGVERRCPGSGCAASTHPWHFEVRLQHYSEGLSVKPLHVGSFDDEGPVLERMHARIADQGLHLAGVHHEIYFSDARKVAPEKLRTLLRQPVTQPARVAPTVQK